MLARAREIAEDVLFPAALDVDAAESVPASHLDLLAAEGFYGLAARDDVTFTELAGVVEALAGGDLATTFVWIQHHTPVRALTEHATPALRDAFLPRLLAGERRSGIGIAGIRTPTPLRVRPAAGGYLIDGQVPWVTGWGMVDTLYLAALDADGVVHFLLADAGPAVTVSAVTQRLVAVQASATVNLTYRDHPVPADRLVYALPFQEWSSGDATGSAMNGFLALGVAGRCARLLEVAGREDAATALRAEADACRDALLRAGPEATPAARAAAAELVWRAAGMLTVQTGARSVLRDNHAQRLAREAAFLLVFGSRPAIRDALLPRLAPPN